MDERIVIIKYLTISCYYKVSLVRRTLLCLEKQCKKAKNIILLNSDTETANPLVAGYEDDLSSIEEVVSPIQPKLAENPLSKQKHKLEPLSGPEINIEKPRQAGKRDSVSSIEQELRISNDYETNEQPDMNSDAFDSWLRRDSKWRQSPEGGEDVSSISTRKDRLELSDKSLDVSVTSSNVHLELLDDTSIRHVSSNGSSPVMKERKKHKDKVLIPYITAI